MATEPTPERSNRAARQPLSAAGLGALAYALVAVMLIGIGLMPPHFLTLDPAGMSEGMETSHAELPCGQCHEEAPGTAQPVSARLAGDLGQLCGGYHRTATEASHPIEFAPDRPLPAAFPLDESGRMTCGTCHAFHGAAPALLRFAENGLDLCESCHDAAFFESMKDGGQSLMMSGHFDASPRRWSRLDPYSVRCMGCHDDRVPSSRQFAAAGFAGFSDFSGAGANEHSIGRTYDEAARRGDFRPRMFLAKEMLLPGGRVGCVSCHIPYSRDHGRQPETRNGLCQECHER